MKRSSVSQSGFTIIELVITIVLIGILLPTIVMFLNSITNMNGRASTMSTVNAYVENKIEGFRSAGFKAIPVTSGPVAFTGAAALPVTIPSPHNATYDVQFVDPADPSIKKVTVTVSFRAFNGTETHTYVTYLGEIGVGQ
ncbi:MAG: type II secretion system protein [Candidatus Saccharimonadales bacterium]